jgi:SAM-dependent methyltransferase
VSIPEANRASVPASCDPIALHAANRESWEMAADGSYLRNRDTRLSTLREGQSTLTPVEHDILAPLCRAAEVTVHLQCADGRDTISLSRLGSRHVIGVDIAPSMLDLARFYAGELSITADWVCCDVLEVGQQVAQHADVVYTGKGALMWVHDIVCWAQAIRSILRPGGHLVVYDLHPVACLFRQDKPQLEPTGINYFGLVRGSRGWPDDYVGDVGVPRAQQPRKFERVWSLSDIFSAVLDAGLVIRQFGEHAEAYWNAFPQLPASQRGTFPVTFTLTAQAT